MFVHFRLTHAHAFVYILLTVLESALPNVCVFESVAFQSQLVSNRNIGVLHYVPSNFSRQFRIHRRCFSTTHNKERTYEHLIKRRKIIKIHPVAAETSKKKT